MYRIYDRKSAIREVQTYLRAVGNPEILVVPSGVFDDNTRLSVIDFQEREGFRKSGTVDQATFDRLYELYVIFREREKLTNKTDSFISFPLLPGRQADGVTHINRMLSRLLGYYGYTHNLRPSSFYSTETENGVRILREIYGLEDKGYIDEVLYIRMLKDHDSIDKFANTLG